MRHGVVRQFKRLWTAAAIGLALSIGACDQTWSSSAISASKAQGQILAQAIGAYRDAKGVLPKRLDDLIPVYIGELKPPQAGEQQWEYVEEGDGKNFQLAFSKHRPSPPMWFYLSRDGKWHLDGE